MRVRESKRPITLLTGAELLNLFFDVSNSDLVAPVLALFALELRLSELYGQ